MVTMLLGGLWHGANWTFVVWGGLHGLYLWVEKWIRDWRAGRGVDAESGLTKDGTWIGNQWIGFFYALLTFMLVNITWVFFRSASFAKAWQLLESMFGLSDGKPLLTTLAILKVSVVIPAMLIAHWLMRSVKVLDIAYKISWWWLAIIWSAMLLMLIWAQESSSSFIYFQF